MADERKEGAFISSLKRNNKQIREDRATAIGEDTQLLYKRQIEDLEVNIKRMEREQENMLDLSPTSSISLDLVKPYYFTTCGQLYRFAEEREFVCSIKEILNVDWIFLSRAPYPEMQNY